MVVLRGIGDGDRMDAGGEERVQRSWWRRWWWAFPAGAAVVAGALVLLDVVWTAAGGDRALRVDAARTTFSILIGLGGVVTLVLLIHRQILTWSSMRTSLRRGEFW